MRPYAGILLLGFGLVSCTGGPKDNGIVNPADVLGDVSTSWMDHAATSAAAPRADQRLPYNFDEWVDFSSLPTMDDCRRECFEVVEEDGKEVLMELEDQPADPCDACREHVAFEINGRTIYWHEIQGMGLGASGQLSPGFSSCFPGAQTTFVSPWQRRSAVYQGSANYFPYQSQVMAGMGYQSGPLPCQGRGNLDQFLAAGRLMYDLDQSFYAIERGATPEQVFYELERRDVSGRMDRYGTPSLGDILGDWLNALRGAGEGLVKGTLYSVTTPLVYTAQRMSAAGQYSAWALKNQFQHMGRRLGQGMYFMRFNTPTFCGQNNYPQAYQFMCGSPYGAYGY